MRWKRILPLLVLVAAVAIAAALVATRPQPLVEAPRAKSETVVVQPVTKTTEPLIVEAKGRVIPALEISVQPQLTGKVENVNPQLVPGGLVATGDVLFTIETVDYQLAEEQARTRVAEAEAALALEQGRQRVAQREYALFEEDLPAQQDPALALREPQLKAASAAVAAARAQLRQARVSLARTRVTAPFNAIVRSESIDAGQIVSPQTRAAQLAGTDRFWVQAAVAVGDLPYIDVAGADHPGSQATLSYDTGRGAIERNGEVVRLLSDLDAAGQMARVLIAVEDPLGLGNGQPRLLLESYVNARIQANREIEAVRLPRQYLHNGNEVYLYDDGVLEIRQVEIAWRRPDTVLIGDGLDDGDLVVTSTLSTPVAGMKLRIDNATDSAAIAGESP